ncbi:MAG: response regulator transcription factor [Tissierellia bacterium]|nr:response regulator transcription factor [Tissierellia bacterium]
MTYKLLIVNKDREFIDNFIYSFKSEDYEITAANTIKEAMDLLKANSFELAIIDMQYKDGTGLDLKRKMNDMRDIPTLVVSESNEPNDKVLALEYGCDDYIVRPFYLLELKARIRAVLRRTNRAEIKVEPIERADSLIKGLFEFNILGRKVKVDSVELDLTGKEFDLLYILVSNKNKVFTRRNLADELWKGIDESNIRTVDVHIRRLREKLEPTKANKFIQTSWGEGYYFDDTYMDKKR